MESVVSYRILSCIYFRISIYDGPIGASPAMTSRWRKEKRGKRKEGVWHQSVRLHYMNTTAMPMPMPMHRQSFIPPSPGLLSLAYLA